MPRKRMFLAAIACGLVALVSSRAAETPPDLERETGNLAAFARVYGYVRFFHPSDQAATVDWDKFAIVGVAAVRDAKDQGELRAALLRTFQPVAPRLRLSEGATPDSGASVAPPAGERLTYWQHAGLNLTDKQNGVYWQQRVITGETKGGRGPLFQPAAVPPPLTKTLASGLMLAMPLALPVDAEGKTVDPVTPEFSTLETTLGALDLKTATPADWRVRVAGIVEVWSIFQHFHPYLDQVGVKWDEALVPALRRALRDESGADYTATLMEMISQTRDGHGYVYGPPDVKDGNPVPKGGIPIRVAHVEGKVVVTGVAENAPFRKGDIIEQLDGVSAAEVLRDREHYTSGSPHLRRFRALNQYGEGTVGSVAHVQVMRDGQAETIDFPRTTEHRGYFFNWIGEFAFPAFAEVRPGIFYVNLYALDAAGLEAKLPQLAEARGVIFDWRSGGRGSMIAKDARMIQPHADIVPHLIDQAVQASPMLIPQILLPDRAGWTYRTNTWPVQPKAPRFKGRVVFINEPSVVSYGETCMAIIADYHLATLVGAPTAGCNGNANFIPLPGGFRVMWTGMDVRKHDGSRFYDIGFVPDYPVTRTLRSVKEGRDEYLEKAIEIIEQSPKPAEPAQPKQG